MKRLFLILAFLLCLMLCGCANAVQTPAQDKLMTDIFNTIENNDYGSAKDMMSGFIDGAELDNVLPEMSDYISGTVTDYTKIGYYYNTSITNGKTRKTETLTYDVKTQYDKYVVQMMLQETPDGWKVYSYNIIRASEAPVGGNIIDFNNFDVLQLAMLIFSAACIGFIIYAIVICAKSRIRLKPLWIILIILLQAGFIISKTGLNLDLRLMIINVDISKLLKYINGDYVFTLVIPVGAMLFLCLRKRLKSSAEAYYQRKTALITGNNNLLAYTTGQMPGNPEKREGLDKEEESNIINNNDISN